MPERRSIMTLRGKSIVPGTVFAVVILTGVACAANTVKIDRQLERGRYLAKIAGCNDCHTAGYLLSEGKVAEKEWLTGDRLGWNGPWGTTYAPNLRLFMATMTEKQWLSYAKTAKLRVPMPWYSLNIMTDQDLRAIYLLVRHLGPAGEPAPAYLPPGKSPEGPSVVFPQPPPK
jgi:mono/diheme cytochrome c family protein